ncbi:alanine/glycine:cation symporter family protein [Proteinivorax tanatarense]|uniref:Alanine/glycine:cation symporter family protein n=1 Tax=Proteinivorax tanatarense TaxID=1260629 RepID=A0AAU7VK59_9FIRM
MVSFLENVIALGNTILWSYVLIFLLIGAGTYFTIKSNFVQFRFFKEMFRLIKQPSDKEKGVSPFQAFCISTASKVGTGNLAGVALAISVGGPGAVFWMWLIALVGAASSFIENTLAQVYKIKDKSGYRGGPAYYMDKALGKRWMGVLFSVLITVCFGLVFNSVQSNTISFAFEEAFGLNRSVVGLGVLLVTATVIFGGVKRIAKVSAIIVPIMASAYIIIALFILITNITMLPEMFSLIIGDAFGFKPVLGGGAAAALMQGIRRGLFSNEAGMGSAPNAAATAVVSHPVKQGLIQTLGVFTDTIFICSATAFIILLSGEYVNDGLSGIQLTQAALSFHVGSWGNTFIAISILLFSFSSIIGNYYYGETNIEFLKGSKMLVLCYRVAVLFMVFFGSLTGLDLVWSMADLFMGSMALINLIAIIMLSNIAFKVLNDYIQQRKEGKDPIFYSKNVKGLENVECWEE